MFGRIQADNFFNTTIASLVDDVSLSGTFTIASKTVNGYALEDGAYIFWMIVGLENQATLEVFRITNVSGTTLTYDKRISPSGLFEHAIGSLCVMTVASEFNNRLSDNTSDFGYVETVQGTGNELAVKVYGGRIYKDSAIDTTISDTTITLPNNETDYIYFDDANDIFGYTATEPASYYVCAKTITASGSISSIDDYRANIVATGGGGGGGGHVIKLTDQSGTQSALTQRDTMRFKKLVVTDDNVNLETIVQGKRLATPDYIPASTTEYISTSEQMIVFGGITIDGTLDNQGTLCIL